MCGIAGIVSSLHPSEKEKAIRQMTTAIAHRGPDWEGVYVNEKIALGHRRLSIIDLSAEANQPFWDADKRFALVFNGEIYNYREVRAKLEGFPFRTISDTEVVLAAYIRWGANCLQHFAGMFAFAIWDNIDNRLFIARDRLGIKPLYFSEMDGQLVFASEIRAVLASGLVRKKLSKKGLHNYLTYQTVHAPNTMIENLWQLKPGTFAVYQNGVLTKKEYWNICGDGQQPDYTDYSAVKKNVRRLLLQSVERRMVSDVPLGAFLSGGIDSSAVVALMAQVSERPVETFSVVFDESKYDESHYSNLIAKKYKTNHHPIPLKPTDFLDALPHALQSMDSPTGDGVNTYVVSKMTKEAGVTVALSGLGGDELFAGYSIFGNFLRLHQNPILWNLPLGVRKAGAAMANVFLKSHQQGRFHELATATSGEIEDIYPAFRKILTSRELGSGAYNGFGQDDVVKSLLQQQEGIKKLPLLSQLTVADISTYTQNVLLKDTDQFSMAHALEVRVPFFDHDLVEYVLQIPDKWKPLVFTKKLLVDSLHPLVPDEVVHRPKIGFNLPWKVWMKNELGTFCKKQLDNFDNRGLPPPLLLGQLWKDFASGKNDFLWSRIWIFVMLEDWLERMSIE